MSLMKNNLFYKTIFLTGKATIRTFGHLIDLIDGKIVFSEPDSIGGLKTLEDNYLHILTELEGVMKNREIPGIDEFFVEQGLLAENRSWKSFPLFIYGTEFLNNTALCPKTRELLLGVDGFSSAMFSVLTAGKRIPEHKGIYKGVLRAHLGLIVPPKANGECFITVDGQKSYWENGKLILFDDAHIHSAHNETDMDRVVLFIDVIRPLPWPLSILNKWMFNLLAKSSFISETVKKYEQFGNKSSQKIEIEFKQK